MSGKYLSIDTEATGLHEGALLIQFALVPVDAAREKVLVYLGRELLVHCPTFEELQPTLNPWVLEYNKELIVHANRSGITREKLKENVLAYLNSPEIKELFGDEKPVLLGKSLSALDIPILTRYLGREFMENNFHHHTLDLTSVAHFLVDAGKLPEGCQSTTELIQHFKIREEAKHTALSDAIDMANIYLHLMQMMKKMYSPRSVT